MCQDAERPVIGQKRSRRPASTTTRSGAQAPSTRTAEPPAAMAGSPHSGVSPMVTRVNQVLGRLWAVSPDRPQPCTIACAALDGPMAGPVRATGPPRATDAGDACWPTARACGPSDEPRRDHSATARVPPRADVAPTRRQSPLCDRTAPRTSLRRRALSAPLCCRDAMRVVALRLVASGRTALARDIGAVGARVGVGVLARVWLMPPFSLVTITIVPRAGHGDRSSVEQLRLRLRIRPRDRVPSRCGGRAARPRR
jgi:hypothetical protein